MLNMVKTAKYFSETMTKNQDDTSSISLSSIQRRSGSVCVGVSPCSLTLRCDSFTMYSRNLIRSPFGDFPTIKPSLVTSRKLISFAFTGSNPLIGLPSTDGFLYFIQSKNYDSIKWTNYFKNQFTHILQNWTPVWSYNS